MAVSQDEVEGGLSEPVILAIKGLDWVLRLQPLLTAYADACGQQGRMADLAYFLDKPAIFPRKIHLLLFASSPGVPPEELTVDRLHGAVLLYEYSILGLPSRVFAIADRSGRGVIAPEAQRLAIATRACDWLMTRGAHVAMLSLSLLDGSLKPADVVRKLGSPRGMEWTVRHRNSADYLHLLPTLDETLASMGQKSRFNLRYYRRRAEKDLGATFDPAIQVSPEEIAAFNRQCMYTVSDSRVKWRLAAQKMLQEPVLMGVKDTEGRWLSILAGRRWGQSSEILWQLNRRDLPQQSVGVAMRSYFIEHEISRGVRQLYIEGGTAHSIKNSFVPEHVMDIVVVRPALRPSLTRLTARLLAKDNDMVQILGGDSEPWIS